MLNITVRELKKEEVPEALALAWKVFQEYEAPDYTQEGVAEFYSSICDEKYISGLRVFGAYSEDNLIGTIATRSEGTHIALLFVESKYHRRGVGKQLFQTAVKECPSDKITVNSSPYAVAVYHKLGFCDTDVEQVVNGLRFTPMEAKVRKA